MNYSMSKRGTASITGTREHVLPGNFCLARVCTACPVPAQAVLCYRTTHYINLYSLTYSYVLEKNIKTKGTTIPRHILTTEDKSMLNLILLLPGTLLSPTEIRHLLHKHDHRSVYVEELYS